MAADHVHYRTLRVPCGAPVDVVDQAYADLSETWNIKRHPGNEDFALKQLRLIDAAYQAILPQLMKQSTEERPFTMKEVVCGQDRIIPQKNEEYRYLDHDLKSLPSTTESDEQDLRSSQPPWNRSDLPSPPPNAFVLPRDPSRESSGDDLPKDNPGLGRFRIIERFGDLLEAPDRAIIVQSVNCQGIWAYGLARQLRDVFPGAYKVYQDICRRVDQPADLVGASLLIPPQPEDGEMKKPLSPGTDDDLGLRNPPNLPNDTVVGPRRWIACLFTSIGYGQPNADRNNPGQDPAATILRQTRDALERLRVQLEDIGPSNFHEDTLGRTEGEEPGDIWACKFNSAFKVDWNETKSVLIDIFNGFERPWSIIDETNY